MEFPWVCLRMTVSVGGRVPVGYAQPVRVHSPRRRVLQWNCGQYTLNQAPLGGRRLTNECEVPQTQGVGGLSVHPFFCLGKVKCEVGRG
jgi:hypothetical protein